MARSTSSAWTGGTWRRCSPPATGDLCRTQEPDRLGEGQWRHGHLLSLPPRADLAFKNGTAPHINSFELGQHGRYRTNVWQYRGVNTLKAGRMDELALHPTVKPVQMIADAIKDVSRRGDDRARSLRRQRLDADRRAQDRAPRAISANSIRSTATGSSGAGRPTPRTTRSGSHRLDTTNQQWNPGGCRMKTPREKKGRTLPPRAGRSTL